MKRVEIGLGIFFLWLWKKGLGEGERGRRGRFSCELCGILFLFFLFFFLYVKFRTTLFFVG